VDIGVNWYAVSGVLITIGLAYIAFLRDRMKVVYRVEELERRMLVAKEDADLLGIEFHSDVDKIMMLAMAAQEAARLQGKDLRVRDFALILRHRQSKKAKGTNANGPATGQQQPPASAV
jgi:hypothetical protein